MESQRYDLGIKFYTGTTTIVHDVIDHGYVDGNGGFLFWYRVATANGSKTPASKRTTYLPTEGVKSFGRYIPTVIKTSIQKAQEFEKEVNKP